jgi:predicted NBD/HSP70 family sugar kinase
LTPQDVARAAEHGDPVALELLARSGRLVGGIVATVVNVFNPELIVVGGGAPAAGDVVLANIRQAVYTRSLPLATRDLRIVRSPQPNLSGLNRRGVHRRTVLPRRPESLAAIRIPRGPPGRGQRLRSAAGAQFQQRSLVEGGEPAAGLEDV